MKQKIFYALILALFLLVMILIFVFQKKTVHKTRLRIFTYSSFQSSSGPGPVLVKIFEESCDCKVDLIRAGSAGLILQRMKLIKESLDMVIGFDKASVYEAKKIFSWKSLNLSSISWDENLDLKAKNLDFIPYDFSPMTFIYRKNQIPFPPQRLEDLLSDELRKKIVLQDPRQSTPGLEFLLWTLNETRSLEYYKKLKKNIFRISPSWSSSYGLFTEMKARLIFSYLTSLVYHWKDRSEFQYQALSFKKGHPLQIEYMAIPSSCKNCELAERFARFLLSKKAQKIISQRNYMYPSVKGLIKGTYFERLPKLKIQKIQSHFYKEKQKWIDSWKTQIMRK